MDYQKQALELLEKHIQNKNLIKHNLAAGALMEGLAEYFGKENEKELWKLAGLTHDLDWELTANDPKSHAKVGAEILAKEGFPEEVVRAVRRHNFMAETEPPETLMEKALYYCEEITGLVVAAVLVLPSKKLSDLTVENVLNRFNEKAFSRGVNRELIRQAPEKLGIGLEKLTDIAIKSMQKIHQDLEL